MFDYLLEPSRRDDSNKWSNIGFDEEIGIIEVKMHTLSVAVHLFQNYTTTEVTTMSSHHWSKSWPDQASCHRTLVTHLNFNK